MPRTWRKLSGRAAALAWRVSWRRWRRKAIWARMIAVGLILALLVVMSPPFLDLTVALSELAPRLADWPDTGPFVSDWAATYPTEDWILAQEPAATEETMPMPVPPSSEVTPRASTVVTGHVWLGGPPPEESPARPSPLATPAAVSASSPSPEPLTPSARPPATPVPDADRPQSLAGATTPVRILMYHYVRAGVPSTDPAGRNLSVAPADFEAQMRLLVDRGFTAISLDDLAAARLSGAPLPAKPVVLTFDDGYADFYSAALPVLERFGLQATVYVIAGKVGQPAYLSWDQIAALAQGGFTIASHTVNHPNLKNLSPQSLQSELTASRQRLEAAIGRPVQHFCYPSGAYDSRVRAAVVDAGYLTSTTTQSGTAKPGDDLLLLPRLRVSGSTTLAQFAFLLGERL